MVADFEQRLASVLGGRLPAPFTGRVQVAPGSGPPTQPRLLLGVVAAQPVEADLGMRRPEVVPGATDLRRVVRLACTVVLDVRVGAAEGRPQAVDAVDAALYGLDAPDLRDGTALAGAGDQGFLIERMGVVGAEAPLAVDPVRVQARAEGWFWPRGVPGADGREIDEVHARWARLPVSASLDPAPVPGGDAVTVAVLLGTTGRMRLDAAGASPRPFGRLALFVAEPGGLAPGAGTLGGGTGGAAGVRLATVEDGRASMTYTPPADPARDELVVALDDGAGGLGVELGRFPVTVEAS